MNFNQSLLLLVFIALVNPLWGQGEQKKDSRHSDQETEIQDEEHTGTIVEFKKIGLLEKAFQEAERGKPFHIDSLEQAEKYLDEKSLERVKEHIDFEERHLLMFAWSGSGQDKMVVEVMESYPEQLRFILQRGRTRDLRSHAKLYSIRKNVIWK